MNKAQDQFVVASILSRYARYLVEETAEISKWTEQSGSVLCGIVFTLSGKITDKEFGELLVMIIGRTDFNKADLFSLLKEKEQDFFRTLVAGEMFGICPGLFSVVRSVVDGIVNRFGG